MVWAVATAVALARKKGQGAPVSVKYSWLAATIKGADRHRVRAAVDRAISLGVLDMTARFRGGVTFAAGQSGQRQAARASDKPAPTNQTAMPVGDGDRVLQPEHFTTSEHGLPYPIEGVLQALYDGATGPRGGHKFRLDSYFNERTKWRKKLMPIVRSMADREFTLEHARRAGLKMRSWQGRTVSYLVRDGGDQWLELLEQIRSGKTQPQSKGRATQRARNGL